MKKNILLIEDEKTTAGLIAFNLHLQNLNVIVAPDGQSGLQALPGASLLILDLSLPDLDGLEVCRLVRAQSDIPILILTGRSGEAARVTGLNCGADDYLEKPFSMAELSARVRALLRRTAPGQVTPDLVLHPEQCALSANGVRIELTRTEFSLFSFLAQRQGTVFTREELLFFVWGFENPSLGARGVDVTMARLRSKFSGLPFPIRTIRGIGYRFESPKK